MTITTALEQQLISPELLVGEQSIAYQNRFVSVAMIPSEFESFSTIADGTGKARKGGAALISDGERILLVKQNRYAVGFSTWEAPRGAISGDAESGSLAGLRELHEETGIIANSDFTHLGFIQPDSGILNSRVDLLFSRVEVTADTITDHEVQAAAWFSIEDVYNACIFGDIEDAFTLALVFRARARNLI